MKLSFQNLFAIIFLILLIFLASCSGNDTPGPEPTPDQEFELSDKIIGKWNVDHSSENLAFQQQKQSNNDCYIFSFIFKADGTFIINHRLGTIRGTYTVKNESTIDLHSAGTLSQIKFTANALHLYAELTGICEGAMQASPNSYHYSGQCYSFLNCNDGSVWKSSSENGVEFIKFADDAGNVWYRKYKYINSFQCLDVSNNEFTDGNLVLVANDTAKIKFIRQLESGNEITTYVKNEDGTLKEIVNNPAGSFTKNFEKTNQDDLDTYLQYPECGEKTYIPDDVFESYLISMGYDNVLDDYVLTENINKITKLALSDHSDRLGTFTDLTGLQDFTSLTDLEIQVGEISQVDISKNINLERIFISMPQLTSFNITKNTKLKNIYFDLAQIDNIDFSQNTELESLEITATGISSINIIQNKKLKHLTVEGSHLSELKSERNENLTHLNIEDNYNQINFDVSDFPNLTQLWIGNNKISSIDISTLENLEELFIDNNELQNLDISHNTSLKSLWTLNNPDLPCIKVNEEQLTQIQNGNLFSDYTDNTTEFSLDCGN